MKFVDEVSIYNTNEIERRLLTSDTKFEVLRGYIGAIITESETDELRNGDKTMYSRLASSELTIDRLVRNFSTMSSSVGKLETKATRIQESVDGIITEVSHVKTTAEGADTKVTNLAVTVNGVSTRVEQVKTEAVNEAGAATDAKLSNYKKTTELMSYINQQSGSINLGVIKNSSTLASKTDVSTAKSEAINSANSNTANLLKSYTKTADLTIDVDGIRTKVTEASIDLTGTKNAAVSAADANTDAKLANYKKTSELMSYINQQSGSINLGVIKNSSTLATNSSVATAKTEAINRAKGYADSVGTAAQDAAKGYTDNLLKSYTKTADLTIDIDGIRTKVTEANIDLSGTIDAAVEEADANTDEKLANYKKTTELMSYINQQSGSINLGVIKNSSTLASKTDVSTAKSDAINSANSNTANLLKSYTKTADLTIDINGISTKVTEANIDLTGTKNAAVSEANTSTDNKLKDYKKTSELMTYINQTSGGISLGAIAGGSDLATKANVSTAKSEAISSANTNTANALKDYTKTADLKISVDGIQMKVTEANIDLNGTKKAATNAAKNYTDSQLNDYTKTNDLVSYINLQSGRIALGVIDGSSNLATKSNVATAKSEAISSANTNTTNTLKNYATKAYADQAETNAKSYTDGKVKPASIIAEINSSGSSIQLNANKIKMDADTLSLWGEDIRMEAGTIVWDSEYSHMSSSGYLTVEGLYATSLIKVAGSSSSYVKIAQEYSIGDIPNTQKKYAIYDIKGIEAGDGITYKAEYVKNYARLRNISTSDYTNISPNNIYLADGSNSSYTASLSAYGLSVNFGSGASGKNTLTRSGLAVTGYKNRIVDTSYGPKLLYCYETPSPLFGDIGEGVIAEDGLCYIPLDPVFLETITKGKYQVFLQVYGDGTAHVKERQDGYFVVQGTPGLAFGWELKAKQFDGAFRRLDDYRMRTETENIAGTDNYVSAAMEHIDDINAQREVI